AGRLVRALQYMATASGPGESNPSAGSRRGTAFGRSANKGGGMTRQNKEEIPGRDRLFTLPLQAPAASPLRSEASGAFRSRVNNRCPTSPLANQTTISYTS